MNLPLRKGKKRPDDEVLREAEQARAERLVRDGLNWLGRGEAELKTRRKGDPSKLTLARQLRSTTTMPLAWIAGCLNMGRRGYLAWLL